MDIRKENIKKIQEVVKNNKEVANNILYGLYNHYLEEVGIETILNFLKKEDGMNFRIQNGITEPGVINFATPEYDNPEESEIDKILRKNKIPYTQEQIKSRLIQYFVQGVIRNTPTDKLFENEQEIITFLKSYEMAFLYNYLVVMASRVQAENKLKKQINKLLREAVATLHAKRQFEERFLYNRIMSVGLEIETGKYEEVGTYKIDDFIIQEIEKRFRIIIQKSFPKNKSYAVKLLDIPIDSNEIQYFQPDKKHLYQNRQLYRNPFVFLNDAIHDSNGNCVYVIIRHGEIATTMLVKNYSKISPDKMAVDFVIKDWDLIVQNKVR